jgi:hypothetical protein
MRGMRWAVVATVSLSAVIGCGPEFPAPVLPSASRTNFNAYADGFTYVTTHFYTDKQILVDSTLHNTGPLAEIQPQSSAHRTRTDDLANGVILARIITYADTLAFTDSTYAHFAIKRPGTYYWFVRGGRSYYVPRDTTLPLDSAALAIDSTSHHEHWDQALARWRWSSTDEQAWTTCNKWYCCIGN